MALGGCFCCLPSHGFSASAVCEKNFCVPVVIRFQVPVWPALLAAGLPPKLGIFQPLVGGWLTRAAVGGFPLLAKGLRFGIFQPPSSAKAACGRTATSARARTVKQRRIRMATPRAVAKAERMPGF